LGAATIGTMSLSANRNEVGVCVLRPQTRGYAANERTIEDLRLCRGSSSYKSPSTKRGTPASQAPQEFQNIYPIPTTTVFIPSTAKSGGLHIVRPPVSAKIQLRKKASYLHKMPCIREPLRAARVVPLFRFGEKHPHAYNCAQKEEEREPQYL